MKRIINKQKHQTIKNTDHILCAGCDGCRGRNRSSLSETKKKIYRKINKAEQKTRKQLKRKIIDKNKQEKIQTISYAPPAMAAVARIRGLSHNQKNDRRINKGKQK